MTTVYIRRLLDYNRDVITVDTPSVIGLRSDEPLVVITDKDGVCYRQITRYNTQTGIITVGRGELRIPIDGSKPSDKTIEQRSSTVSEDISTRLAIVVRTIRAASAIFEQIGQSSAETVSWRVTRDKQF